MNTQLQGDGCVQMVQGLTVLHFAKALVKALLASLLAFLIRTTFSP